MAGHSKTKLTFRNVDYLYGLPEREEAVNGHCK
jgi:hypothetical protein